MSEHDEEATQNPAVAETTDGDMSDLEELARLAMEHGIGPGQLEALEAQLEKDGVDDEDIQRFKERVSALSDRLAPPPGLQKIQQDMKDAYQLFKAAITENGFPGLSDAKELMTLLGLLHNTQTEGYFGLASMVEWAICREAFGIEEAKRQPSPSDSKATQCCFKLLEIKDAATRNDYGLQVPPETDMYQYGGQVLTGAIKDMINRAKGEITRPVERAIMEEAALNGSHYVHNIAMLNLKEIRDRLDGVIQHLEHLQKEEHDKLQKSLTENDSKCSLNLPIFSSRFPNGMSAGDMIVLEVDEDNDATLFAQTDLLVGYLLEAAATGVTDSISFAVLSMEENDTTGRDTQGHTICICPKRTWAFPAYGKAHNAESMVKEAFASSPEGKVDILIVNTLNAAAISHEVAEKIVDDANFRKVHVEDMDNYVQQQLRNPSSADFAARAMKSRSDDLKTIVPDLQKLAKDHKFLVIAISTAPKGFSYGCPSIPTKLLNESDAQAVVRIGLEEVTLNLG